MDNEARRLKAAFERKEQNQASLADLESLKQRGTVDAEQYRTMKADYQQNLTTAVSEIANIKSRLKLQMQATEHNLTAFRDELEKLDVRHKVGEITLEKYNSSQQELINTIGRTGSEISELQKLIAAKSSAQIGELPKRFGVTFPVKELSMPRISGKVVLSPLGITSFVIAALMLISFFFMPALSPLGVNISFMQVNPAIGIVCLLAALAFAGAVFLKARTSSGKAHLGIGIVAVLVQIVVLFMVLHDASKYGYSGFEFLAMGFWLYVLAAIAGIVVGVMESRGVVR